MSSCFSQMQKNKIGINRYIQIDPCSIAVFG